jgi:hypothetical protein
MSNSPTIEMQAAVQAASDRLADALLAGGDTGEARAALEQARTALQKHQDAELAARREHEQAEQDRKAADTAAAEAAAVDEAVTAVNSAVAKVQLPEGIEPPAQAEHPLVAAAAADLARIKLEIKSRQPDHQAAAREVASLAARAKDKRAQADAIRSRRQAGQEKAGDGVELHLLESDATDLEAMVQAAEQRSRDLGKPIADLRASLAATEQKLKSAQTEAALHGQADRVRVLEAALIAAVRELRASAFNAAGYSVLPQYFTPTQKLRDVSYGLPV